MLLYAGIKGKSVPSALQSVIQGRSPAGAASANPITGTAGGGGPAPVGSIGAIASNALLVIGHPYHFGGAPGPNGDQPWDCSSCGSWVIGKMSGLPIPGGDWAAVTHNGSQHGPSSITYLGWSGAQTIGHHSGVAQPGDLCVWQTHMGICVAPGEMVSALNESKGTLRTPIDGVAPAGEFLFVRRIVIGNPHA